jgi:hypothetical protein
MQGSNILIIHFETVLFLIKSGVTNYFNLKTLTFNFRMRMNGS